MGGYSSVPESPKQHNYSIVVPHSSKTGVHGPIRHAHCGFRPETEMDGVKTAYENFNRSADASGDRPCLGTRPIVDGKAQPYVWMTYSEVKNRRDNFGAGMMHLGMLPVSDDNMRLLGIYSKNRAEWVISELAAYAYSATVVPLYDSLGSQAVEYALNQTKLATLICNSKEVDVMLATVPKCKHLKNIILIDNTSDEKKNKFTELGIRVMLMSEVEKIGKENPVPHIPPTGKVVASFCYTSGTTGDPKGALITHENFVSDSAAAKYHGIGAFPSDVYLSYLPLPHMFERIVQFGLLHEGAAIGFFQGDTLKILEDLQTLRPTLFASVPRLLNRVHDKILQGVKEKGGIGEQLFNMALAAKLEGLKTGTREHTLWDALVFNKVKARLGFDRCRAMITGSAPISGEVLNVLRCIFCVVQEGYGQTESTAGATATFPDDFDAGHVGGPLSCCEITLADVPEMGYLSTDTVHGVGTDNPIECQGRGEICFRGPLVFAGYYKMPEKTAEVLDEEGWLHSGDIGLWLPNGALKIVDRKKNIFKLSQGEYVAPEKLENIFNGIDIILQSFVYGDSLQSRLVAVVVPDPDILKRWAATNSIEGTIEQLCENEKVKQEILKEMGTRAREFKLAGFEFVKAIHLEPKPWTPDTGILTPTFKLKRNIARDTYRKQIDRLYETIPA
eukprot:c17158_g1_i1.p1 GENE.c17158_g1_i1~~c17158_g1_i1.p1  ORF type:complete len:684 (+),score=333.62 c17158_g1_i1:32-2053(+)